MAENEKKIYWDIYRTLTHNALFNMILSIRGNGKSYGVKKRCIENFIKKKTIQRRSSGKPFRVLERCWKRVPGL